MNATRDPCARAVASTRLMKSSCDSSSFHQQSTAAAVANAQVTIEGLIADAEAARAKAMAEKGGAAAAVSALIAKAKLAGMWREKAEKTKSGPVILEVHWPHVKQ